MTLTPAAPVSAPFVVLGLVDPLPGFPLYRDYALVATDTDGLLFWLRSVDPDGPRFLAVYFPHYAPVPPGMVCAELDLEDPADAQLY